MALQNRIVGHIYMTLQGDIVSKLGKENTIDYKKTDSCSDMDYECCFRNIHFSTTV